MKSKEDVLEIVIKSKKYSKIKKDVICKMIDSEYDKYKSDKLLIKEVKNKLHQIHEIFLNNGSNEKVIDLLNKDKYDEILKLHMSSLERLNFYSDFYKEIFLVTGIPNAILDLACGYNPFSIKYMNLNNSFIYYAYDINEETSEILNVFFAKNNYNGISRTLDLSYEVPSDIVDVAFILKFLPLLERQNKFFSTDMLKKINSKYIVVSFPTKTVTGKNVGMLSNYKELFNKIIDNYFIILKEIVFENELVFIITKDNKKDADY